MNYAKICQDILSEQGPLLGSELQELLIDRTKVTPINARQIILRIKREKVLLTTDPVKFLRNQVLYFLPRQNIQKKLRLVLPDHAKTFDRVYQALIEQEGFLQWAEFCKIAAGVVNRDQEPNYKHKAAQKIYEEMCALGLVNPILTYNNSRFVVASEEWVPTSKPSDANMAKRLRDLAFTRQFTSNLLQWLERMNLAGWNSTKLTAEDDETGLNGFYWDAVGYCYIWGMYKTQKRGSLFAPPEEKTGSLILIESVLHRVMKKYDVAGFISRVDVVYGKLNIRDNFRIIPICFVQSIDEEALAIARKRGVMVISITEVFGAKIAEALSKVRDLDPRNVDPTALAEVLSLADNSGQDGKFGSLKGYVFNFLVASIFSNYGMKPRLGKKYEHKGLRCECDIVISEDEYLIVCETKGYNKGKLVKLGDTENEPDTVKKFFERTCRIVEAQTGKKVLPVFITSGDFKEEAMKYLQDLSKAKKIKRILEEHNFPKDIFLDRAGLEEIFGSKQTYSEHRRIMREYFTEHKNKIDLPISKVP